MLGTADSIPSLSRIALMSVGIALVATWGAWAGAPVDWGTAVIYGMTIAIAMRWPIIMPRSGLPVVIPLGLYLMALWIGGLPTAAVAVMIDYGFRIFTLHQRASRWDWYYPALTMIALGGAYAIFKGVMGSGAPPHSQPLRTDVAVALYAYGFWMLRSAAWTMVHTPDKWRIRLGEYIAAIRQTWWVPLSFMGILFVMDFICWTGKPLQTVACFVLIMLQWRLGTMLSTLYQDRAVADLVRSAPAGSSARHAETHQVLWVAHKIARALSLPDDLVRLIGYAVLLQEILPEAEGSLPRWFPERPGAELQPVIKAHVERTVRRIGADRALLEVAELVRYRYADYDGQGYPAVAGETIPMGAQVLTAANAIVQQRAATVGSSHSQVVRAVEWLRTHAASRFSPALLDAMILAFVGKDLDPGTEGGLPDTVRQLQTLVNRREPPSLLAIGLRRIWLQVRGGVGLAPTLPAEVQAVARLANFFATSNSATQTAQIAVEALAQLVGGKAALLMTDGDGHELSMKCTAACGFQRIDLVGRTVQIRGGEVIRAMLDNVPIQVADLREIDHPFAKELVAVEGVCSALLVPLVGRGRPQGLLGVAMPGRHWFSPRETGVIQLLAGQAATALENARLFAKATQRLEHISRLKAFTDTLLDNLSVGIVVVDSEMRLVLANAAARYRFTDAALPIGEPLSADLADLFRVRAALDGASLTEIDVAWESATLEVDAIPMRDGHGMLQGAICLARDVTQVRTMEHQVRRVEKMAAIGEMAAGAAHEIRNPLTAIRGFIQLLAVDVDQSRDDYHKIILGEIDRIDGLIRDLLLLARPDLKLVQTSLAEVIDEVLLLQQAEFERAGIEVIRRFDPQTGQVPVDPKMFRQLVLNLVINAIQAMPSGGQLCVSLERVDEASARMEVADTGGGIPPEYIERLFVPFFTTKEQGTGLGLALCYSIVEAHQGRLDVESQMGEGTCFAVTLPAH